jgi:hypothetical protein
VNDGQPNWFVHSFEVVRLHLITGSVSISISISIEKAPPFAILCDATFSIGKMSANFTDSAYFVGTKRS